MNKNKLIDVLKFIVIMSVITILLWYVVFEVL